MMEVMATSDLNADFTSNITDYPRRYRKKTSTPKSNVALEQHSHHFILIARSILLVVIRNMYEPMCSGYSGFANG